jgi:hypothetical protein
MKPRPPGGMYAETRALQAFVDAVREVLRLGPLYHSNDKPTVERFGARFLVEGSRTTPSHWT